MKYWLYGLIFSVVVGGVVPALFLYALRGVLGPGRKPKLKKKRGGGRSGRQGGKK